MLTRSRNSLVYRCMVASRLPLARVAEADYLCSVSRRLVTIAAHVDLLYYIRYLLFFKLQPNLLTVGAPGSMVSADTSIRNVQDHMRSTNVALLTSP